MTAPTHVVIGLATSIALARANGIHITAIDLLCIIIGSLMPDLDTDEGSLAKPGKILKRFFPRGVTNLLDGITQALTTLIRTIFGHRGMLHWPVIGIALFVLGGVAGRSWVMWIGWGYLWHILADFCTVSGVPLLGPFYRKDIKWSSLRTGSKAEKGISVLILLFVIVAGYPLLPEETRYWLGRYYNIATGSRQ